VAGGARHLRWSLPHTLSASAAAVYARPPPPRDSSVTAPLVLVVLKGFPVMAPGDKSNSKSPAKRDGNDHIIDVDAEPSDAPSPSSAKGKGKRVVKAVPGNAVIDVDDPNTWACPASSAVGASSSDGVQEPLMKFAGVLGATLYDQKLDVMAQDAEVARVASTTAVVLPGASSSLGDMVSSDVGAAASEASAVPNASALEEPFGARPRKVARLVTPMSVPGALVMPPGTHGHRRSKWNARKPFVRKAAVMSVRSSAPRMVAYPPTPPYSGRASGGHASGGGSVFRSGAADVGGRGGGGDSGSSSAPGGLSDAESDGEGTNDSPGSCVRDGGNGSGGSGSRGAGGGGNARDGRDGRDGDDGGGGGRDGAQDTGAARAGAAAAASDALANELAARTRNPRLFPAAFWAPGAQDIFAAASASRAGLPPIAPGLAHGFIPSGVGQSAAPVRATTPRQTRASPAHSPVPAENDEEDGSSEEMDDDALVMAYVTPPASPAPVATPLPSPLRARATLGKRRRASDSRVAREPSMPATAGTEGDAGTDVLHVAMKDLHEALRNGLSSLRREFTRFRAELVIVKSQAASSLRRMDGISVAVEGRDARAGVVLECLAELSKDVQDLGSHVTKTSADVTGNHNGDGRDSVALVTEIKVCRDRAYPLLLIPTFSLDQSVAFECVVAGRPRRADNLLSSDRMAHRPWHFVCSLSQFVVHPSPFLAVMCLMFAQELFLEALMTETRTASTSAMVFPSTGTVNAMLLRVAARVMGVSETVAAQKLQAKMMLPVRKPEKGMALVVAYQYVKRVVGHLSSSLTSICVTTFVKRTHAIKGIGSWSSPSASSTRRVLTQSPDECMDLLRADAFIKDAFGRLAMLDALNNFIDELGGTAAMVSWTGPNKATRVIRCLFGHVASVSFRVS